MKKHIHALRLCCVHNLFNIIAVHSRSMLSTRSFSSNQLMPSDILILINLILIRDIRGTFLPFKILFRLKRKILPSAKCSVNSKLENSELIWACNWHNCVQHFMDVISMCECVSCSVLCNRWAVILIRNHYMQLSNWTEKSLIKLSMSSESVNACVLPHFFSHLEFHRC